MLINKFLWYSIFIPLLAGTFYFRRLNLSHKYLYGFVVTGVCTELIRDAVTAVCENHNIEKLGVAESSAKLVCRAALIAALEKQGCTKNRKENFKSFLLNVCGEKSKKFNKGLVDDAATHALFDFKRLGVENGHCMHCPNKWLLCSSFC